MHSRFFRPALSTAFPNLWRLLVVAVFVLSGSASLQALPPLETEPINGSLTIIAKAEVEIYVNGQKYTPRDRSPDKAHYRAKLPGRQFKAGDAVVLHARSPFVYRAIAAAILPAAKGKQVPVTLADWRFLGKDAEPRKITAAEIQASQEMLAPMHPDGNGEAERDRAGMIAEDKGGSSWVKTKEQLNGWYCVGFVITPEMVKASKE